MAPSGTQPLDGTPVSGIQCDALQIVEDIVQNHRTESVKKTTRVVQHHPRLLALCYQLWDELTHAFVTPMENLRVMVIADLRVIHHVLQIADDRRSLQIGAARRN